ncbi:MAG: amidohydrolase family protein [Actinomycetota bacterium]|nr:amidohydrolase family protein [Actinomycetota bacterium]
MATVDFDAFDADNHYYEATDAFIRYLPPHRSKLVQWATIGGRQRMVVDNKVFRFIPNPTFDPVARPGSLDDYFRGKTAGDNIRDAFGELEPINPAYREPEARVKLMDQQRLLGCFLFPTLGVGVEEALLHDVDKVHDVFHAFNEWMHDDWTFNFRDRIYAAPYICLQDPERAAQEVDWALERGAHVVVLRAGPIRGPGFSRSPGDEVYDSVWARIAEAGIVAAYHSGDAGYGRYADEWGSDGDFQAFRNDPFRSVTSGHRPIYDTVAALVCHGVIRRHPNLRVATIESGSDWMPGLVRTLKKSYGQTPGAYDGVDPVQQVRDHVWVSPYYEDPIPELRDTIGAERIIFGSDYPHAEGLADPLSFVDDLRGFTDAEVRLVMRENCLELSKPRR